jgi:hypothetical protein
VLQEICIYIFADEQPFDSGEFLEIVRQTTSLASKRTGKKGQIFIDYKGFKTKITTPTVLFCLPIKVSLA